MKERRDHSDSAASQRVRQEFEDGEEKLRQWRNAHPMPHFFTGTHSMIELD
jgi:hypothetical protein